MNSLLIFASLVALANGECEWTAKANFLNYGVNHGGCYVCEAYKDDEKKLTDFCRELCIADPECKSFEVAPGSVAYDLHVASPLGARIQCRLEYSD